MWDLFLGFMGYVIVRFQYGFCLSPQASRNPGLDTHEESVLTFILEPNNFASRQEVLKGFLGCME